MTRLPTVVTRPGTLPVSLDAAKRFLRLDGTDDDVVLSDLIEAATDMAERFLGRSLIIRTLKLTLNDFPLDNRQGEWWDGVRQGAIGSLIGSSAPIPLPRPPIAGVVSITTYNAANSAVVIDPATYRTSGGAAVLNTGLSWPGEYRDQDGIEIVYTAGYGPSPSDVPASIRQGILQQTAAIFENRECSDLSDAAVAMLQPYRLMRFG